MDGFQVLCTVFVTIAFYTDSTVAGKSKLNKNRSVLIGFSWKDHEYMVTNAESITVPLEFETKLQCVMNIEPDKFQWKFYPLEDKDVYNPQAFISLTKGSYVLIPPNDYTTQRHQSDLTLQVRFTQTSFSPQICIFPSSQICFLTFLLPLDLPGSFT